MQSALESLPGVANVTTDVDKRTATCRVDPSKFDQTSAITALADAGYDGSTVVR